MALASRAPRAGCAARFILSIIAGIIGLLVWVCVPQGWLRMPVGLESQAPVPGPNRPRLTPPVAAPKHGRFMGTLATPVWPLLEEVWL
jgi:hypothetical protein